MAIKTLQNKDLPLATVTLESVKNGRLVGYFLCQAHDAKQVLSVEIDGKPVANGLANYFRPDLDGDSHHSAGKYCGFNIPIDVFWYDGRTHEVVIKDQIGAVIYKRSRLFPVNPNVELLKASLLATKTLTPSKKGGKIAIVAGFSDRNGLAEYQARLLRSLCEQGYYVIYSVALADDNVEHRPLQLEGLCHALLIRRNVGYDFGSWAHAWLEYSGILKQSKEVLFINDSMVGPIFSSDFNAKFAAEFDALDFDLCGVTESYQRGWHVQSYLWRVNSKILKTACLDDFFYSRAPLAATKEEAIANYELELGRYFLNQGFSVGIWANTHQLKTLTFDSFQRSLQHQLALQAMVYQSEVLTKAMTSLLAEKAVPYLKLLLSDEHHNPAQHYWKGLVELGFPFIKKEFLTKNSVSYPFVEELSSYFDSDELRPLLVDLLQRSNATLAHSF